MKKLEIIRKKLKLNAHTIAQAWLHMLINWDQSMLCYSYIYNETFLIGRTHYYTVIRINLV